MSYDAGNIGNHEFNYGLPFLSQVTGTNMRIAGADNAKNCAGPGFPLVLSNALNKADNQPIFKPYVILDRTFKTADGKTVPLKVGVIGVTPTQITMWDKLSLDGKVVTQSAKDAADKYIPEMKKAGADIIVAVAHGGIDDKAYVADTENPINYLSTVPGVTAIVSGHSHSFFPDGSNYSGLKNIDNKKGLVNGIPTVMAGFWGKALGVIKLNLQYDAASKAWKTVPTSYSELKYINPADDKTGNTKVTPEAKPEIGKLIEAEHKATIDFVNSPVGTSEFRISSFFAQVGPTAAMRLINLAQIDYVKTFVKNNLPQYANLPVLSAAAPFKVNFRGTGFTDIAAGPVAIKNVADLYLYPNTLQAVKITGADVKAWLEVSAKQFNQIDPAKTSDQALMSTFPSYNFDQIEGVTYEIDVTKPIGSRIVNLQLNGKAFDAAQEVIVATNNYRAGGGGGFPLTANQSIIVAQDANRDIIVNYIKTQKNLTQANHGAKPNWRFVKTTTAGNVLFSSSSDTNALKVAAQDGISNIAKFANGVVSVDANGKAVIAADVTSAVFKIDLSK
jgi:2',3'-cyclic-nucleotide 2'-phosphodiesterase/3'-nucleotidase